MAQSSSCCVYLSSYIGVMEFASRDNHTWRRKCESKEDKETMALMRLLVAQDKLIKRSKVKLSQGIICLFTHLCAYGEMLVELKNSPCHANLVMPCVLKMRSYSVKLVVAISMLKLLEKHATILIWRMMN
jgi:hypothetical protein